MSDPVFTFSLAWGALAQLDERLHMSAQLSLPPERPTITRSPSSIRFEIDDRFGRLLGDPGLERAAVRHSPSV